MSTRTAKLALATALLVAAGALSFGREAQAAAKPQEAKLIAVLKSDAKLKEKADACRQLARIATRDAVPVLAALLGDEKLSHMARYALEPIPDPAVDEALRDALGKLKGRALVGVIGSLGARRDAKAAAALARLLRDSDADVAQGAARALGSIGTPAAIEALEGALAKAPQANRLAVCEGLFRCAEALVAKDQRDGAIAIYDRLRSLKPAPHQVRAGGLRGAVLTRGEAGVPLLVQALRGEDLVMVAAAARTAMEMPGAAVTKALAGELGKLSADKQILLTQVLGKRGDAAALPALFALAKKGDKNVRIAAIRALPEIGDAAAAPVLVSLLGDKEGDVARAAQDALGALAGPEADAAIAAMLKDPNPETRRIAIEQIGQRRPAGAIPALLKAAEDPDEKIRVASLKILGSLAGAAEFPALIGLLLKAKASSEIQAAERSLSAICIRQAQPAAGKVVIRKAVYGVLPDGGKRDVTKKVAQMVKAGALAVEASNSNFGDPARGVAKKLRVEYTVDGATEIKTVNEGGTITITAGVTPPAFVDALCAALPQAPTKPKLGLLRVLRSARGPKALAAVRAATTDADAEVKNAAISLLCSWPTAEALPAVTQLAKTSTDPRTKILALRGCFRLIPLQDAPAGKKLAALKEALALAERNEEKRLALAVLGAIPTADALALVVPHLGNPGLKEEASLAAVAIAEKIVRTHPSQVVEAMGQVSRVTANKDVAKRARGLLGRARSAAQRK